jgi:hypothetical protein
MVTPVTLVIIGAAHVIAAALANQLAFMSLQPGAAPRTVEHWLFPKFGRGLGMRLRIGLHEFF